MTQVNKSRFGTPSRLALGALALGYCFTLVPGSGVLALLRHAAPGWLVLAALAVLAETAVGAWRFKLLYDAVQALPYRLHLRQFTQSQFFNLVLPGSMGGDAARVLMLGASGGSRRAALAAVLLDRLVGVASLLALSALALPFTPLPGVWAVAAAGASLACLALAAAGERVAGRWPVLAPFVAGLAVLRPGPARPARLALALAVSLLYQALTVAITACVVASLALPVPLAAVFALTPLVWLATFVPLTLAGIGLRELAFVALFGQLAVAGEASVAMSLGTFGALLFAGALGAAWWLAGQHDNARQEA